MTHHVPALRAELTEAAAGNLTLAVPTRPDLRCQGVAIAAVIGAPFAVMGQPAGVWL